ncbi:hypothetical protein A3Q56_05798 [Intoshia linei]|uniref:Transposase n=1 Tax=Intoshia linei TaxID=1819745 RepID=A0A177AYJ4_9BILA|nr:hypothetical protein A3Q56_05798 [Intoshia linei]
MGRGKTLNDNEKSQIIKLLADKTDVEEICTILNRNCNTIRSEETEAEITKLTGSMEKQEGQISM